MAQASSEHYAYLINLDRSPDRRAAAEAHLNEQSINFLRLSGIDGSGKHPEEWKQYQPHRAVSFLNRPMTGGEMGCYLSHLNVAKTFLETEAPYCLVLEDDARVVDEINELLQKLVYLVNDSNPDWEIINLGKSAHKLSSDIGSIDNIILQRTCYFPLTTTAIVWSRRGAEALLDTENEIYAPVDLFFRRHFALRGMAYATNPPLAFPNGSASVIDEGDSQQSNFRLKRNRSFLHFWREFQRQSYTYLFAYKNYLKTRIGGNH